MFIIVKLLLFGNLMLDDFNYEEELIKGGLDSEKWFMEMFVVQVVYIMSVVFEDEDVVVVDLKWFEEEKKDVLQRMFIMVVSNGNLEFVNKILNGKVREYIDVNVLDDEGMLVFIYVSCFVSVISYVFFCKLFMLIVLVVGI